MRDRVETGGGSLIEKASRLFDKLERTPARTTDVLGGVASSLLVGLTVTGRRRRRKK